MVVRGRAERGGLLVTELLLELAKLGIALGVGYAARPALDRLKKAKPPKGKAPFDADAEEARRRVSER